MTAVPRIDMPPGKKFQALWAALHLGAVGLAIYVAVADLWKARGPAPKAAGMAVILIAAFLHSASALYHGQRALS